MERSNNKIIVGVIIIAAVVLIAVAASMFSKKEEATSQIDNASTSQDSNDTVVPGGSSNKDAANSGVTYKDGTYVVSDTYSSPGGIEDIKVTLTISGNSISDVSVVQEANNDESAEYQQKFQQGYKSKVVGKSLSSLELSRSSGASLTTNAFNDALEEIRTKAKA